MSEENVEIVRAAYAAFNRTQEPLAETLHPYVEWHTAADLPDSGTHRGVEGIAKLFSEWLPRLRSFNQTSRRSSTAAMNL